MSAEFCDTNVLAYTYDRSAGWKRDRAMDLIDGLWQAKRGAVSVQVLQELFVTLTRKLPQPLSIANARTIVSDLCSWRVVEPTSALVLTAIDASQEWNISFWDAMIVTAAIDAGAQTLWTEDLSDGQVYGTITARNPFTAP